MIHAILKSHLKTYSMNGLIILLVKITTLTITVIILTSFNSSLAQLPFYYKIKQIEGYIYTSAPDPVSVKVLSRRKIEFSNEIDTDTRNFLNTLWLTRYGRKAVEHLLKTNSKIKLIISENIGIDIVDGKYRVMYGIAGPGKNQSDILILNYDKKFKKIIKRKVFEENSIILFKGSLDYGKGDKSKFHKGNVTIINRNTNEEITEFNLDTIKIEPFQAPEWLYQTLKELYYLAGIHEIYHTTSKSIYLFLHGLDPEEPEKSAMKIELKAKKKLNKILRSKKLSY